MNKEKLIVQELIRRTESGELTWNYRGEEGFFCKEEKINVHWSGYDYVSYHLKIDEVNIGYGKKLYNFLYLFLYCLGGLFLSY